jgi:hypothetical protein
LDLSIEKQLELERCRRGAANMSRDQLAEALMQLMALHLAHVQTTELLLRQNIRIEFHDHTQA